MPELPEVETVRNGLKDILEGVIITRVEQNRQNLRFPFPEKFTQRLEGEKTGLLGRRAKYLLVPLSGGETLVVHLGMSGTIRVEKPPPASQGAPDPDAGPATGSDSVPGADSDSVSGSGPDPAHDHVIFHLSNGATLRYNDPRRFGFMTLVTTKELSRHKLFRDLGPEPLGDDFHARHLAQMAIGRKTPLKNFLLNQKNVAGLGNIYVCEALFRARLSPTRQASTMAGRDGRPVAAARRLTCAIRQTLTEAIAQGGSTLRDHRLTDGSLGYFQHSLAVYGRENKPCKRPQCNGTIRRITQAGRSTFFCPQCQK